MRYPGVERALFLRRPNRFIAEVQLDGKTERVHVKNTGRCRELLVPGCTVYLHAPDRAGRKTRFDLVTVEKREPDGGTRLINMDSQLPNDAAAEWLPRSGLFSDKAVFCREVVHGDSRVDFYAQDGPRRAFIEVKGCTLERSGTALFPDAPTERGSRHLRGLVQAVKEGFEAYILFVIQMKGVTVLRPNVETDPVFARELAQAARAGVRVLAMDCRVTPEEMVIEDPVRVEWEEIK